MSIIRVAIDGPSGAGKSTLAKAAAKALGFLYVDTGALYRTIGLYVCNQGIDPSDEAVVATALPEIRVELRYDASGTQRMLLNGEDVSGEIRLPEISRYSSAVSALPAVRAYLLETQRNLASKHSVIMDGRRSRDLEKMGTPQPFKEVLRDIEERDWRDTHRDTAPLRQAEGAVLLDTSEMDFQESQAALLAIIRERVGQ